MPSQKKIKNKKITIWSTTPSFTYSFIFISTNNFRKAQKTKYTVLTNLILHSPKTGIAVQ